ncbi:MFS general substrate transporter [Dichomitus squalens]|uniref:MFS general substrate transporter n=1 Tax=Dichomitus squalens TaxID=114155 RepID=A0A4Q9MI17_9APHY|nr:MFS general substrate transporter [Dichomitus squalens]
MLAPPNARRGPSTVRSPVQTLVDGCVPQRYSVARRYLLLIIFWLAQFLNAFHNSALLSATPLLVASLDMNRSESTWISSAFQITFASFLPISGRISDTYYPKSAFIGGVSGLGVLSIGAGFVSSKNTLIVLRALTGIAGSMLIPSALRLLVNVFTEPAEQARAIGIFGGCSAVGNVLGLIVGEIFVQSISWSWVFWFVALVWIPIATLCIFLIPKEKPRLDDTAIRNGPGWKRLDITRLSILTVALILFIFAVTSGATSGWGSPTFFAPLIIAVFLVGGFFYFETTVPADRAAIPPRTWFLSNFLVLFFTALLPFFWWTTIFTIYMTVWQDVWKWSAVSTAIHMIPIGVLAFAMSFTGPLSRMINSKWIILFGEGLCIVATILFAFADRPERYWPYIFPAFVLGSAGAVLIYTHTNMAFYYTSPSSMAGTVGAIFNVALQLGSALGISVVGSIKSSVENTHGGPSSYAGCAAAYWFLLGIVGVEFVGLLVFYRTDNEGTTEDEVLQKANTLNPEQVVMQEKVADAGEGEGERKDAVRGQGMHVNEMPVLPTQGDRNV